MKKVNLAGQRFNRLIVIEQSGRDKRGQSMWLCLCDCKNETIVRGGDLRNGKTKSCGCLRIKHGLRNDRTYNSWIHMIDRCTNSNHKYYHNYGGRGITVCNRWINSLKNFKKDMGERPLKHQIDRIDNNKGYCKGNCRWVTSKQNNRNRRNNHMVVHNGKLQLVIELAEKFDINYKTLLSRLNRGWTPEEALMTPVRGQKDKKGKL